MSSHARPLLALILLAAPLRADTLKVPADFETIQAAVDVAVAGDVVLVSKGTYVETVSVETSGITLKGKNAVINARYLGDCIAVDADDVSISGFTLLYGGTGGLALTGDGDIEAGGLFYAGSGADIAKLVVRACDDYGIRLAGTGAIDKCDVRGCNGPGIQVETPSFLSQIVTDVTRNEVRNCFGGFLLENGPFAVEKNRAESNYADGIVVSIPVPVLDGLPQVEASVVSGNTADNNDGDGFVLSDGASVGMLVDKNVSHANGWGMVAAGLDHLITGNTLEDNTLGGLRLDTTSAEASGNKLRRNGQVGVLVGAFFSFADGSGDTGNNVVRDNRIEANGGDGVRVSSSGNVIDDNSLRDNLGDGVDIEQGNPDNQLLANQVTKNLHDGLDNSGDDTLFTDNASSGNGGADLAGTGTLGAGTVSELSAGNVSGDGTDLGSGQELDLETID